jgi:hypothetical protein
LVEVEEDVLVEWVASAAVATVEPTPVLVLMQ